MLIASLKITPVEGQQLLLFWPHDTHSASSPSSGLQRASTRRCCRRRGGLSHQLGLWHVTAGDSSQESTEAFPEAFLRTGPQMAAEIHQTGAVCGLVRGNDHRLPRPMGCDMDGPSLLSLASVTGIDSPASLRHGHSWSAMRLPHTAHTTRPWRIHEFTRDFQLKDVWALPTPGGHDDFHRLVRQMAAGDPRGSSVLARTLWAIWWRLGKTLHGDPDPDRSRNLPTLRDRSPADLCDGPAGPEFDALPFRSL